MKLALLSQSRVYLWISEFEYSKCCHWACDESWKSNYPF